MRQMPLRANLPQLTHKRPQRIQLHQSIQGESHTLIPSSQLVFHINHLPLDFHLQYEQRLQVHLSVNSRSLTLKTKQETINLPWTQLPKTWISVSLGTCPKQVKVDLHQNQNHLGQIRIYTSLEEWTKHQQGKLVQMPLQKTIKQLKDDSKIENVSEQAIKGKILGERRRLKIRTTERARTSLFSSKTIGLRREHTKLTKKSEFQISRSQEKEQNLKPKGKTIRFQSQILSKKIPSYSQNNSHRNQTSNSVRSEGPFKPIKRLKYPLQTSQKKIPHFSEDLHLGIIETESKRPRKLKFFEQVPFTFEEIQLKRQKFQSQFIDKVSTAVEESEVIQDICRGGQSNLFSGAEQTFQQGLDQLAGGGGVEESGTLCQSVFE